ncbi:ester cyclase [Arenibacter sp. M-2]|uniref:ester cyclase n=1 Tax=unclassified Arenibacter TaxID=2615047 RepID=UPI000D750E9D|nr:MULTISPECIES: ester cyclase [unclassified Arenibacter]MDL5511652.1 ester cyclase [Arenibacter sp. M-2]|tara:strand:+ start:49154 stop:49693 length:540 start_codon:yes stop_codon:yes gene_type:complete
MKTPMLFLIFMVIGCVSCKNNRILEGNETLTRSGYNKMVAKKNKLETSIIVYLNLRREKEIDSLVTDDYVRNMNGIPVVTNKTELKARLNLFGTGFPDYDITMGNCLVCDNQGYVDWMFTGTNTGQFAEVMATGKKVKINGFSHLYFNEEGQIYREDIFYNELEFLQQLGYSLRAPNLK